MSAAGAEGKVGGWAGETHAQVVGTSEGAVLLYGAGCMQQSTSLLHTRVTACAGTSAAIL